LHKNIQTDSFRRPDQESKSFAPIADYEARNHKNWLDIFLFLA